MNRILEVYKDMLDSKQRFVDEVFEIEDYRSAVPQLTIIDLGAYEGEFSFYCYNFAKKIYAIEPDPLPYKILDERIKKYELDRVECFPIALSGDKGERTFHASGFGGSRLLKNEEVVDEAADNIIRVDSMSLAQFMEANKIEHVDILKVDIEDGEYEVFLAEDFKQVVDKIDCIIGEHLKGLKETLIGYGFKAYKDEKGVNTLYKR